MAGINDLMKKYGLEEPPEPGEKPAPEMPKVEAPELVTDPVWQTLAPEQPVAAECGSVAGQGSGKERKAVSVEPSSGTVPKQDSGEERQAARPEPSGGTAPGQGSGKERQAAKAEPSGGTAPGQGSGGGLQAAKAEPSGGGRRLIARVFKGGRKRTDTPAPRKRWKPPAFSGRPQWLDRLPPFWGIDLGLIVVSVAGLVYIGLHWSMILLTIAQVIYTIVNGVVSLGLFLLLGAAAWYFLRNRM